MSKDKRDAVYDTAARLTKLREELKHWYESCLFRAAEAGMPRPDLESLWEDLNVELRELLDGKPLLVTAAVLLTIMTEVLEQVENHEIAEFIAAHDRDEQ